LNRFEHDKFTLNAEPIISVEAKENSQISVEKQFDHLDLEMLLFRGVPPEYRENSS
jgi:hypothetical protein